jgi:diacylglycerol kinase (ATP)
MRNQPRYNFFKNTSYALKGLKDLILTETSFKIELLITILVSILLFFIDFTFLNKIIIFMSMLVVLIAEAINSAIERVVDLVTLEHNIMAGRAKDIGSSIVFLTIFLCLTIWFYVLLEELLYI